MPPTTRRFATGSPRNTRSSRRFYKGVFAVLREPLGLSPELVEGLSAAAGMRNVLVHAYLEVDDDRMWDALGHLDDLREFAAAVRRVEEQEG